MEVPSHPSDRILRESYVSPSQETILEGIPGWDTVKLDESFTPSQPMHCSSADETQSLRLHVRGDDDSEDEFYDGEISFPKQEPVECVSPPETQGNLGDSYDSAFESDRSQSPINREGSSPPFALLGDLISSQYRTQSDMAADTSLKIIDGGVRGKVVFVDDDAGDEKLKESIANAALTEAVPECPAYHSTNGELHTNSRKAPRGLSEKFRNNEADVPRDTPISQANFNVEAETLREETNFQRLSSGYVDVDISKREGVNVNISNVAESQSLTTRRMTRSQKDFDGKEVTEGTRFLKRKTRVEPKSRTARQRRTFEEDRVQDTSDAEIGGTTAVRQKTVVEGEIKVHCPPQEAALRGTKEQPVPNKHCEAETAPNSSGNNESGGNSEAAETLITSEQVSPRVLTDDNRLPREIQDEAVNDVRPSVDFSERETRQSVRQDPRNFPESVMDVVMFHSGSLPPCSLNDPSLLSLVMKAGIDLPLPFDRNYVRH